MTNPYASPEETSDDPSASPARSLRLVGCTRSGLVFLTCLGLTWTLPLFAIFAYRVLPRLVSNDLILLPQFIGSGVNGVHWIAVLVVYGCFTHRISKFRYLVPTAIATILLVTIATNIVFEIFGLPVELDGP